MDILLQKFSDSEKYQRYVEEVREELNSKLADLIANLNEFKLFPQLEYALLSRGKRLRPTLTILSGQCVGGQLENLYPIAMANELIHTASLIHDDIVDEDKTRRGISTLYKKWKNKAILTGDIFYALACNLITSYGSPVWDVVSEGAIELCDGQFMDVSLTLGNCSEEDYFTKIRKKSAALFRVSSKSGAIVGGGNESEITSLGAFGKFFGMAYQLRDDLMEVTEKNGIPTDLKNGRVTLPYLHLHQNAEEKTRRILEDNFGRKRIPKEIADVIMVNLAENGSLDYCKKKLMDYTMKACDELNALKENQYRNFLLQFAHDVLAVK